MEHKNGQKPLQRMLHHSSKSQNCYRTPSILKHYCCSSKDFYIHSNQSLPPNETVEQLRGTQSLNQNILKNGMKHQIYSFRCGSDARKYEKMNISHQTGEVYPTSAADALIGTSTKVDITGLKVDKFDDKYFAKESNKKKKRSEGEFF